jgi:GTP-binding protein Era
VAIVGAPNAGKSQLLNSLVGLKVAAVSRKRHTTRTGILGARTLDDTQLVFIDTPGFLHHKMGVKEGIRKLLGEASSEMECADFTLVVVDAAKKLDEDMKRTLITLMFLAFRSKGRDEVSVPGGGVNEASHLNKFAVVLNKVDLVKPKDKLLVVVNDVSLLAESCIRCLLQQRRTPAKVRLGDLVDSVLEKHQSEQGFDGVHEDDMETFAEVAPDFLFTSAIDEDDKGVEDVMGILMKRATPSNEWIVDAESTSMMSPLEQVEEIVREKVYRCLHREVPHSVQQQNRLFQHVEPSKSKSGSASEEGNLLRIHQDLIVRTKSHKRLVMGSGGKTLERIRSSALRDLENAFQCEVDLVVNVRISKSNHEAQLDASAEGVQTL